MSIKTNPYSPGCGNYTNVEGTNGGVMPCGAFLSMGGDRKQYFCNECTERLKNTKTKYVTEIVVNDPDTGNAVELEVHKDPTSGALFAIDSSFLDQMTTVIASPFNPGIMLELEDQS